MKYCYGCNRITEGEPLYCNFCGRSYNLKLCSRNHPNPRHAMACSKCGSRDFSTPQPRVPFWAPALEFLLACVPGLALLAASFATVFAVVFAVEHDPGLLRALAVPALLLCVLWWMWLQIPRWFREAVYRLLKRRREGDGRKDK